MISPPSFGVMRGSRGRAAALACCFVAAAFAARGQSDSMDTFGGDPDKNSWLWIPADTPDWTRHFHIGAIVGLNIKADFSMNGTFDIAGNAIANGNYSDGYVHPGNNSFGQTGSWGYNNASQYNPTGGSDGLGSVAMHSATAYTTANSSQQDGGPFAGFDMVYGDNLFYWKHARVGWELGFSLLPVIINNSVSSSAKVNQSTFTFDTGGIIMPQAPYRGGSGGQAPTISDHPVVTQDTVDGTVTGTEELDVMVYALRFGPSFYWDLNEHLGFSMSGGPAVGIVSGSYQFNEVVSTPASGTTPAVNTRNNGGSDETHVVYGGYVNGTLMYHVINDADFYLSAQYMPMGSATFSDGGREGKLDLGGQVYISVGISWPF